MLDAISRLNASLEGHYRIERELGKGGMATVYLARDLRHDREVALKVMRPEFGEALGSRRFLREIDIAAHLTHPHVVALYDSGEVDGVLYFVMPFIDGESLRERLAREGALSIGDAMRILRDVADALAGAHAKGVVHRDVKPANVLLADRHALVADFGIAKAVSEASESTRLTSEGVSLGTPYYMSPEQVAGDAEIDHRSDVYALGVLAYEMLTGEPVFPSGGLREVLTSHLTRVPPPVGEKREGVPEDLAELIAGCLAKDPNDRPQSADVVEAIEGMATSGAGSQGVVGHARPTSAGWRIATAGVVGVGVIAAALFVQLWLGRRAVVVELERLQDLTEDGEWESAYELAVALGGDLDTDVADALWARFSLPRRFESEPTGATVYRKPWDQPEAEWEELGTTPFDTLLPLGRSRILVTLPAHESIHTYTEGSRSGAAITYRLLPIGTIPDGQTPVWGGTVSTPTGSAQIDDFFIDRYEVSNREYKRFVEAGGYEREEFWQQPFLLDTRTVSWSEAMARFTDRTGRPGPAGWEVGDYPAGQDDYPVTGVSWFEAVAYARFVGKSLPTLYEWEWAAALNTASYLIPRSNLDGLGPAARGVYDGMGPWNTQDMVGNAREWVFNDSGDGRRYALGGGWNDPPYFVTGTRGRMDPWARDEENGFRLITRFGGGDADPAAMASFVVGDPTNIRTIEPASDAAYEVYRSFFAYDPRPLEEMTERADTTLGWVHETVTLDAAYPDHRLVVHVFLPLDGSPPYQPVVYWPGAAAQNLDSIPQYMTSAPVDFLTKAGRAVVWPIIDGTFDRRRPQDDLQAASHNVGVTWVQTVEARDFVVREIQDIARAAELVRDREDLAHDAMTYFGFSWGGAFAPLALTQVEGFRAAVLQVGGMYSYRWSPEVEPLNFVRRVTTPILFMAGQFDMTFDLETHVRPFYELVATPESDKHLYVSQGGHSVPRNEMIRETLNWLDRYVGPPR